MNLVIRKAVLSDAKDIVNINITSWIETYNNIFSEEYLNNLKNDKNKYEEKYKNKIIKQNNYLVALVGNKIVGFCQYGLNKKGFDSSTGEIYSIYLLKEYQNKGIGKKLFTKAYNILKEDYSKVIVSCLQENPSNQFYSKMGGMLSGTCDFILENNQYIENIYIFE